MHQSQLHNNSIILTLKKETKEGRKKAIKILNTNGDATSGNQGTQNSINN